MNDSLLSAVLRPYLPDCRYLKEVTFKAPEVAGAMPSAQGWFQIPKAFYIEDTGHFNAVEFILCFNQIGYMLTVHCALTGAFPEMGPWSMDRFNENQLPNVLIVDVQASFPRGIDGKGFTAKLSIPWLERRSRHLFYDMLIEFTDALGGRAHGKVRVCLRNCYEQKRASVVGGSERWNVEMPSRQSA